MLPPNGRRPAVAGWYYPTDPKRSIYALGQTRGFTLIEVLAAIFLTAVVISVAVAFFVNLSRATEAATLKIRDGRRALAVLDRVARDLQAAYLLVKPADADPLAHPWLFLAESNASGESADRLKFVTRNHRPKNPRDHGSDLAVVTYLLREAQEEPGYGLLRGVEPGLPEAFDREFRRDDDELFMVVAERIDRFSMRFLNRESPGADWQASWDTSRLEEASMLPGAVEIRLSYIGLYDDVAERDRDDFDDFLDDSFEDEGDEGSYVRHVILPMRAIDLDAMLAEVEDQAQGGTGDGEDDADEDDADEGDADEGEDGDSEAGEARTVGDCLQPDDQDAAVELFGDVLNTVLTDDLKQTLERAGYHCR